MMTVWKYPLVATDHQILMPEGAKVLCLKNQQGTPTLWALVNSDEPLVERRFWTFGTGHPMPVVKMKYIGTYQLAGGALVFHVFEPSTEP